MRSARTLLLASALFVLAGACSAASPQSQVPAASVPTTMKAGPPPAAAECYARPAASGDILVRETRRGQVATAQELGGGWSWNYRTNSCMTSTDLVIDSA